MNATKYSVMNALKAKVRGESAIHAGKHSALLSANSWKGYSAIRAQKQLLHTSVTNAKSRRKRLMSSAKVWISCKEVNVEEEDGEGNNWREKRFDMLGLPEHLIVVNCYADCSYVSHWRTSSGNDMDHFIDVLLSLLSCYFTLYNIIDS